MEGKSFFFSLVLCVCAVSVCHGWFWRQPGCYSWTKAKVKRCFPCTVFSTRKVTLVVRNILREDNFEESVTLPCTRSQTLFYMMMEAADLNPAFKFTATYFKGLGFFINAMNGLASNYTLDQTWWEILDGNNARTPVGVSSYKPHDGETVTFNFTQGFGH